MSGFDWIIAAIFLFSALIGVARGFIREALSVASWIIAIWLGITYAVSVGEWINSHIIIPAALFRYVAGFSLVFVSALFLCSTTSYLLTKLLRQKPIKGTDRVLGIGFGAVRATAIVVAVLLFARALGMAQAGWWQNSQQIKHFVPIVNYVEKLLPEQLQSSQKTPLETLNDATDAAQAAGSVIDDLQEGPEQAEAPSTDTPE